jgi:hypothetical protein
MTDRPIIFSAPMVRALLAGRKTQTRRLIKPQPISPQVREFRHVATVTATGQSVFNTMSTAGHPIPAMPGPPHCVTGEYVAPYGKGDRLWVRESWCINGFKSTATGPEHCYFAASDEVQAAHDGDGFTVFNKDGSERSPWLTPIHMPRWASRLTLTVTDVRVQRLQDITEADARSEGVWRSTSGMYHFTEHGHGAGYHSAVSAFDTLWTTINGPASWPSNPWVVALTFTAAHHNIDAQRAEAA